MDLPRDIELAIISKLDIDSRRALGIYTRLKVPANIVNALAQCIPPPNKFICSQYIRISLGDFDETRGKYMYVLNRKFGFETYSPTNPHEHFHFHGNGFYQTFNETVQTTAPCQSFTIEHYGYNNQSKIW
jgi:hypothetical protein